MEDVAHAPQVEAVLLSETRPGQAATSGLAQQATPAARASCEPSFSWLLRLLARQPACSRMRSKEPPPQLTNSTDFGTLPQRLGGGESAHADATAAA